jgi:hypothetical protein
MGALADAFTDAFDTAAPSKAEVATLGAEIETAIAAQTVFDLANMPGAGDLVGKAGWLLVVSDDETGFSLAAPA